jgi:hypothetical protein
MLRVLFDILAEGRRDLSHAKAGKGEQTPSWLGYRSGYRIRRPSPRSA